MPIIKSAIKRAKQTEVRRARNIVTKQALRTEVKALQSAISAKDSKKAGEALNVVQGKLDTAVKKNLMHKNKAARRKASFAKQVAAIGGKSTTSTKVKVAPKKAATKKTAAKKPAAKKKASAKKPAAKKAAK